MRLAAEIVRLAASGASLDDVLAAFTEGLAALVRFDALAVALVDAERGEFAALDLCARTLGLGSRRDRRLRLADTLLERVAATATALRVDDLAAPDVPARSRETFAVRGYRSAVLVPLVSRDDVAGAVIAAARAPRGFAETDVEAIAEAAPALAVAVELRRLRDDNARLEEKHGRGARELRALLEAARSVTASLDLQETIRVILEQARAVLGVASCGLSTLDATTGELRSVASLDLPEAMVSRIRIRAGEGIGGRAVSELRPVQSADLWNDPRVLFPELPRASGLRAMLAAPLVVGGRAVGALTVFRREAHAFSPAEEKLLLALADQAAIALEHARLYTDLEAVVAERTREVEVILETLPLGVFVLDTALHVVRANAEAARTLGVDGARGRSLAALLPAERADAVVGVVREAFAERRVSRADAELVLGGDARSFRLTAAPIQPAGRLAGPAHVVLLMEDVTLARRVERQMRLTERLTIAGRLAAGVAHELNNPLATIAGCAEALLARTREPAFAAAAQAEDFRRYLGLIEEEAYRCKDITGGLLQLTREPGGHRTAADLNAVVGRAVELLSHQSRFAGRRFVTQLQPDLPTVVANEGQLLQVFLGIAVNALEAMDADGVLRIRTRRARGEAEVEFEDEGPGIPDDIVPRIFDPFFTTKPPGQGTGLGLAIAQGIVTDHGGRIEVASRVGKGSTFRVVLPA